MSAKPEAHPEDINSKEAAGGHSDTRETSSTPRETRPAGPDVGHYDHGGDALVRPHDGRNFVPYHCIPSSRHVAKANASDDARYSARGPRGEALPTGLKRGVPVKRKPFGAKRTDW